MTRRPGVAGQLSLLEHCLDERDRAVLEFACQHHRQGRFEARVEQDLGCTPTRYMQLLARMVDRPEVEEAAPELVRELRALRDRRRSRRKQP